MRTVSVIVIGLLIGAIDGVGIFFVPEESYPVEIFIGATLKGILVAFLVANVLRQRGGWLKALSVGALYGVLFAIVIFLAKGGWQSGDAPFVVPFGALMGGIIGLLVNRFAFRKE